SARTLAVAVVATSHPPFPARESEVVRRSGESLSAVMNNAFAVRNLGPTSLQVAEVGGGRLDAFWEYGVDVGNLLPGALIAGESGATVTDAHGRPWTPASDSFVAAAPTLHAELVAVLAAANEKET